MLALMLGTGDAKDTSPRPRKRGHEWFENGLLTKRLDERGRLFLYTWDAQTRQLVGMDGAATRFDATQPESARDCAEIAWSHRWFYDSDKHLVAELDCKGVRHEFDWNQGATIDTTIGTALGKHQHIAEAGRVVRRQVPAAKD